MSRALTTSAALLVVAALTMTSSLTARASSGHASGGHASGGHAGGTIHHSTPSHVGHAPYAKSGYGYGSMHDRNYRNWTRYCWFSRYGCYGYYCGTSACWYYWYGPMNCYLPITRMGELPPTGTPPMVPQLPPGGVAIR